MGKICTFFGHRDCFLSLSQELKLEVILTDLIENKGVDEFWVGNYGIFDSYARWAVRPMKEKYRHIQICFVSAYPATTGNVDWFEENFDSYFCPQEAVQSSPRFAITRRNKWLAENTDYIVCYVQRQYGGAYKAVQIAKKHKKTIINLFEDLS